MPEYHPDWPRISLEIKRRAGFRCEQCNSPSITGRILTVHHFDMNTNNNVYENLIALCQVCHLIIQAHYLKYGDPKNQLCMFQDAIPEWLVKRGLFIC